MEIRRGQTIPEPTKPGSIVRFKFSKISTKVHDIAQYGRTTRALMNAGMTLDILADAGEERGDQVERMEVDAPNTHNLQRKVGEIIEAQDHIQAWQEMGEVLITRQLPNPTSESGIVPFETTEQQKIRVVEGVGVFSNQNQADQLENNRYLNAPADLKKF